MVSPDAVAQWATPHRWVAAQAAAAGLAGALGAGSDGPGRLLAVLAVLLLAGGALRDGAFRPTLAVDERGLTVRTGLVRRHWPWAELTSLRSVRSTRRRLGSARSVELEFGEDLVLLPDRRLGAPAAEVAAQLQAMAPGRR